MQRELNSNDQELDDKLEVLSQYSKAYRTVKRNEEFSDSLIKFNKKKYNVNISQNENNKQVMTVETIVYFIILSDNQSILCYL